MIYSYTIMVALNALVGIFKLFGKSGSEFTVYAFIVFYYFCAVYLIWKVYADFREFVNSVYKSEGA
jgi:cell shape-determining protein MreC